MLKVWEPQNSKPYWKAVERNMDEPHLHLKLTSPFGFEIMFGEFSWCLQNIFRFVYKAKKIKMKALRFTVTEKCFVFLAPVVQRGDNSIRSALGSTFG